MKKGFLVSGPALLVAALLAAAPLLEAAAEVRVNVNLGPPPVVVAHPPAMVLVPGSDVYFVPDVDYDVFFYNGFWWSSRGERWFRARAYNGPWRTVPRRVIPPPVFGVPRDYRRVYLRERRVPYGQWRHEWREHGRGGERGAFRGLGEERWEHEDRGEQRGR